MAEVIDSGVHLDRFVTLALALGLVVVGAGGEALSAQEPTPTDGER